MSGINWYKYTAAEWLEHFGVWCNSQTMRDVMPGDLRINCIYKQMQKFRKNITSGKCQPICAITDDEALAVNNLLCKALQNKEMEYELKLLIEHKVAGSSLRFIADKTNNSFLHVREKVNNALYYFGGKNNLRMKDINAISAID